MIKMKMGELIVADQTLASIAELDLPARAAYDVAKLARLVRQEVAIFEKKNQELIAEFGEERDSTPEERERGLPERVNSVKPDFMTIFQQKIGEYQDIDVELSAYPLDLSRFGEKILLKPKQILSLGNLVKELE